MPGTAPNAARARREFDHQTLRVTPVMASGVTTKLWDLTDMVRVIEDWEAERAIMPGDRLVG